MHYLGLMTVHVQSTLSSQVYIFGRTMNSELFLFLKGTFRVPFRVDLKKRDKEEWLTIKTLDFCFLGVG